MSSAISVETAPSFAIALAQCPLVAILRGVRPEEVVDIGQALVGAGFSIIEVPLNSPEPLESIRRLAMAFPKVLVGAGTVLSVPDIARLADAGGRLVVMPHCDTDIIRAAKAAELACVPGFATPTEAFAALAAGADALKLFPAEGASPAVLKAMRAVLPAGTRVLPVGGIDPETMQPWRAAGAAGFGLGSALYRSGASTADVAKAAARFVSALAV